MPPVDLLANAERDPTDRPPRDAPLVADLQAAEYALHRPASLEVDMWKQRALAAEAELERIRAGAAEAADLRR
jgi:hypothetical protein